MLLFLLGIIWLLIVIFDQLNVCSSNLMIFFPIKILALFVFYARTKNDIFTILQVVVQ